MTPEQFGELVLLITLYGKLVVGVLLALVVAVTWRG